MFFIILAFFYINIYIFNKIFILYFTGSYNIECYYCEFEEYVTG